MINRRKIEKIEENSEEIEKEIKEDASNAQEKVKVLTREEAIIVEEELEKEMKERVKKRVKKEKILYEGNRITKFFRRHSDDVRLMLYGLFLFILLMIGLLSAFLLYAFLGVTTQQILLIISSFLAIVGAIILIYMGQKYLLR